MTSNVHPTANARVDQLMKEKEIWTKETTRFLITCFLSFFLMLIIISYPVMSIETGKLKHVNFTEQNNMLNMDQENKMTWQEYTGSFFTRTFFIVGDKDNSSAEFSWSLAIDGNNNLDLKDDENTSVEINVNEEDSWKRMPSHQTGTINTNNLFQNGENGKVSFFFDVQEDLVILPFIQFEMGIVNVTGEQVDIDVYFNNFNIIEISYNLSQESGKITFPRKEVFNSSVELIQPRDNNLTVEVKSGQVEWDYLLSRVFIPTKPTIPEVSPTTFTALSGDTIEIFLDVNENVTNNRIKIGYFLADLDGKILLNQEWKINKTGEQDLNVTLPSDLDHGPHETWILYYSNSSIATLFQYPLHVLSTNAGAFHVGWYTSKNNKILQGTPFNLTLEITNYMLVQAQNVSLKVLENLGDVRDNTTINKLDVLGKTLLNISGIYLPLSTNTTMLVIHLEINWSDGIFTHDDVLEVRIPISSSLDIMILEDPTPRNLTNNLVALSIEWLGNDTIDGQVYMKLFDDEGNVLEDYTKYFRLHPESDNVFLVEINITSEILVGINATLIVNNSIISWHFAWINFASIAIEKPDSSPANANQDQQFDLISFFNEIFTRRIEIPFLMIALIVIVGYFIRDLKRADS